VKCERNLIAVKTES